MSINGRPSVAEAQTRVCIAETNAEAVKGVRVEKVIVWDAGGGNGAGGGVSRVTNNLVRSIPPAMDLIRHVTGIE